jgi:hypothetical protein
MKIRGDRALQASIVLLCGATAIFCSSSSSSSPTSSTDCGPGPYADLIGHAYEAVASGDPRTKEDVTVTFSICPDKQFTTDANGTIRGRMTRGVPIVATAVHPDDIPATYGEFKIVDATFEGSVGLVPKLFQSVVAPDFGPDKTLVAFQIQYPPGTFDAGVPDGGPTDPCQRNEGVTIAIPDHPEAKVVYFTTDSIPKPDPSATATSTNGVATISGLPDGIVISPVATKPGCHLAAAYAGFTGRAFTKKGFGLIFSFQMTK